MLQEWRAIFDFHMESELELEGSMHDLFALTRMRKEEGIDIPKLYLWCGTEDDLLGINRQYRNLLDELKVEHVYEESEGDHSWKWWDLHIQDGLKYLLGGQ